MTTQGIYYETMYILRPDIAEEDVTKHIEKYNNLLEKMGGKVLDSQMRGKRRLAYPIAKNREGIYVQLSHQGDGQHISKIEKAMRLSEDVIRYMTIKQEGVLPTPKPASKNTKLKEDSEKKDPESSDPIESNDAALNKESEQNKETITENLDSKKVTED
tara:strand:- start:6647 stop:7123 length:477 start_codon:yes stop_codon:yes gene_type:complete